MKQATTLEEQIQLLRNRNMVINDCAKAKEVLLDIGYYRLGFYWFPFEVSYPQRESRNHLFKQGTNFENIVKLYYFDQDLRNCISPYLFRIEIDFRTFLIYTVSNYYKFNPTWFADKKIINSSYVEELDTYYVPIKTNNQVIKEHHKKHVNDRYAPAWKTLEFMTFGNIINLYSNMEKTALKQEISLHYNIKSISIFEEYLKTIWILRNKCAHGRNIYDIKLQKSLRNDPITNIQGEDLHNINGALRIVFYILNNISNNREKELKEKLSNLINSVSVLDDVIQPLVNLKNILMIK